MTKPPVSRLAYEQQDLFDQPTFDLKASRAARDVGVATVDSHSEQWRRRARALVIELLPFEWSGRSEEIRALLMNAGLPAPHSPNCWGSLTLWCVRNGILEPTGELQSMHDPRSHARYTKVYKRVA